MDARDCSPAERRTLLLRGLALWRGPPLAEFAFEAWAETEARRLDDLRLVAVEERIAADIDLDRAADVVPELDALSREHPLRERVCELHMLALYRAGRQADALAAYAAIRKALAELGLEPGERLKELQSKILRHDLALSPRRNGGDADADADSRSRRRSSPAGSCPCWGSTVPPISPQGWRPSSDTRPSGRSTSRASLSTSRR